MKSQETADCPVERTLSVVGSSWTCLILRDLILHGARRFQNGVVERRFYSMSPPRAEYVLTAKGRDLGPIVGAMRDWGGKYPR
jgi:DNA-binding HxlR family transcriptional regulator